MSIKRYVLGQGKDPRDGQRINIDFNPWHQDLPITIWAGAISNYCDGVSINLDGLDRYVWAFECTDTKWLYQFLKSLAPEQSLSYKLVNDEYRKRHGKDMELVGSDVYVG